ncbi:MAG: IPT/TIG domain-containing protein [Bacteroidota bacterium]
MLTLVPSGASLVRTLLLLVPLVLLFGCDTETTTLFDPDLQAGPDPVLGGLAPDPASIVLAGIDAVTLTGQNFSATPSDNLVYFNQTRAEVLEASATQLIVRAPNVPGNDVGVRIAVLGAENYSATLPYALVSATTEVEGLLGTDEPGSVVVEAATGDAIVGILDGDTQGGDDTGLIRLSAATGRSNYLTAPQFLYSSIAFGPDNVIVGARGQRALFRLPEGGPPQTYQAISGSPNPTLVSVAFDDMGGVWTGSSNGNIYYVPAGGGSSEPSEVIGAVRAVAYFDSFLYAAVTRAGVSEIVRFPVMGGSMLGPEELYATLSVDQGIATSIAVAQDGTLFVGTDFIERTSSRDPVYVISTDRVVEPLYTGILGSQQSGGRVAIVNFAWDGGTGLYTIRRFEIGEAGSVANPLTITYDLVRIETRTQGS